MSLARNATRWVAVFTALLIAGCAARVPESGGPERTYYLEVTNSVPHAMNVSIDMGKGIQALGAVEANQTRRFQIDNPGTDEIEVIAADQENKVQLRKPVDLDRDQVVRITLKH